MRSLIRFASALVVAASAASAATAADFTFKVPVTLTNLPAATYFDVGCRVYASSTPGSGQVGVGQSIPPPQLGPSSGKVTGGNFSGTVTVEVNATATTPAAMANHYTCHITIFAKNANGAQFQTSMQIVSEWKGATGQTITVTPAPPSAGSAWDGVSGSVP